MTTHTHECAICRKPVECSDGDGCRRTGVTHDECEAMLDAIAEARPVPRPLTLAIVQLTIVNAVKRAKRAAPAANLYMFNRVVDTMLPFEADDDSLDAWARRGHVFGARESWACTSLMVLPKDAPSQETTEIYCAAYSAAWMLTNMIRQRIQP